MKRLSLLLSSVLLACLLPSAQGALLNLTQTPIFLTTNVPPNVFIQLDDSGSMDWEVLIKPFWEACAYDPSYPASAGSGTTCGTFWSNDAGIISYGNGQSLQFGYIYNNSDNVFNFLNPTGCAFNFGGLPLNSLMACTPLNYVDWRVYSSDMNVTYYNPSITYSPWVYNCTSGTPCANASFTAARDYPVQGVTGYTLISNLTGGKYEVWIDDKGFSGARPLRSAAVNVTTGANGMEDLWDSHVTIVINTANVQVYKSVYSPNSSGMNGAPVLMATISGSACYNILGPTSLVQSIFNGSLAYTSTNAAGCQTISQAQQNFANWYQYDRRRSMAARGALAYVINQYPNFSYGGNTINNAFFTQVPPSGTTNFATYNSTLVQNFLTFAWPPATTPNRSALNRVGQYYSGTLSGTTNPISQACQQNYTIFITDGYWDTFDSGGLPSYIGDVDGDGISQTFADIAYYYYINNLQPSFAANQVPANSWDTATWLHMVTFAMGFGIQGNLVAGSNGWPNPPLQINSNWGDPFASNSAKADDMWHAAFNSKGAFFESQVPANAATTLGTFLSSIVQRSTSASSVAQNSTLLNAGSSIYQAIFNSSSWSGDVLAYPISITGVLSSTPSWSASCMLTGGLCASPSGTNAGITATNRIIITRNFTGANNGIAFRWPANYTTYKVGGILPANLANFLALGPYNPQTGSAAQITANQNYGQALLNYLRGDRSNEVQNGGTYGFRNRTSILGDIIDSSPTYVPGPYRLYPDSIEPQAYSTFKTTYANRTPMVYVGANDGMLHGFSAATGQELFAYIPGIRQIYQDLPYLSSTTYSHYFFVDGSPQEADVDLTNAWHTILVGTLHNGGQGIYAVDITNPANFTESNASSLYLWEFTDQDDPDVGYVEGNVSIAKVNVGSGQTEWAVIFGNGYNNTQADGYASTTGKAVLYVLLIERFSGTWTLNTNYYKIPVGAVNVATPNGLAAPYVVDTNGDFIVDYAYAGDLLGNMWKFDLTGIPSSWAAGASILYTASYASAGDQPITSQPVVGPHPNGLSFGVIVYFGTGQFLQPSDNSSSGQTTQSFYAIWDKLSGTTTVTKSQLVQQQILGEVIATTGTYRAVTSNPINWNTSPSPQNLGWYMNLIETGSTNNGERQVSQATLRNNNIIFTTLIPSSNPCLGGGSSWLMEVNAASGGSPTASPFDVNGDGMFATSDYISLTISGSTTTTPAAGVKSSVGITGTPAVFVNPNKQSETKVLSGSQGLGTVLENTATGPSGRQNWRQLY